MIPSAILGKLRRLLPAGQLRTEPDFCKGYSGDKWFASSMPDAVALPRRAETVAAVLRFASEHRIPVTTRGAGYGYVGSCVPNRGGLVLSLARMKRIREINAAAQEAQSNPLLLQLKQLEVEKARVEKWDGRYPQWWMGGAGSSPNLLLQVPALGAGKN